MTSTVFQNTIQFKKWWHLLNTGTKSGKKIPGRLDTHLWLYFQNKLNLWSLILCRTEPNKKKKRRNFVSATLILLSVSYNHTEFLMLFSISGIFLRPITAKQNLFLSLLPYILPEKPSFLSKVFNFYYLVFCLKWWRLYPEAIQPNSIHYRFWSHSLGPYPLNHISQMSWQFSVSLRTLPALLSSHLLFLYSPQLITTDLNDPVITRPTCCSQSKGEILLLPPPYISTKV